MVEKGRYVTFKLKREFVETVVDDIITNAGSLKFENRAEVIKTALREYHEKLKKEGYLPKNTK